MTALEPNGENGGAGLVATALVRHIGTLAPELRITLLTAQASHAELAALDSPNVQREGDYRTVWADEVRAGPALSERGIPAQLRGLPCTRRSGTGHRTRARCRWRSVYCG